MSRIACIAAVAASVMAAKVHESNQRAGANAMTTEDRYIVHSRERFEHNTDPQRRCYYGCHASSEWRWSAWEPLGMKGLTLEEANESVESWKKIGRKTCEFKAVKIGEAP